MAEKIGMVSLGCAKNQVDAERLLALLQEAGYEICSDAAQCDVVIINTCGFIEDAKKESIENILDFCAMKENGLRGVIVTGCLAERYQEQMALEIPEADAIKRHLDRWTPENHNASYPRLTRSSQTNFATSSFWLEDASYVRLKNISLGYNLPKSLLTKIGVEKAKVFVSGENLLTFSGLDGLDPESPSDTRGAFYSNVKKISLGLKVSF